MYFILGNKFSWNDGIDTYFNVECVLFGCHSDFLIWLLGGYCLLPSGYCWLLLVTSWLLLVTGGYCSLLLVPTHF